MNKYLLLLLVAASTIVFALPTDRQQTLTATSNQATFDQNNLVGTYRGDVHANQGSTSLASDTLTLRLDHDRQLKDAVANGTPATYTTTLKPNESPLVAQAKQIEYLPMQHQVILRGDGFVTRDKNVYRSELIYYNTDTQEVQSPKIPGSRTNIVIQPQNAAHNKTLT